MIILTIRTDKPESEVGLYQDETQLAYEVWQAHRELAETIHLKISELLKSQGKSLQDVEGVVCYKGPGSFTGLRIGLSVANAVAHGFDVPIIGVEGEEDWVHRGIQRLLQGSSDKVVIPEYGAPVHITTPTK